MLKKGLLVLIINLFFVFNATPNVLAGTTGVGIVCNHSVPDDCVPGYSCRIDPTGSGDNICQPRIGASQICDPTDPNPCISGYNCQKEPTPGSTDYVCTKDPSAAPPPGANSGSSVFGKIELPQPLRGLNANNPTGAGAISQFLSNLVGLFYTVAAIVLIFMLLWGAFDWMTSEGEKEKVHSAQQKIMNAIIGMVLFAVTFAVIQILGHFTGFQFFVGQR